MPQHECSLPVKCNKLVFRQSLLSVWSMESPTFFGETQTLRDLDWKWRWVSFSHSIILNVESLFLMFKPSKPFISNMLKLFSDSKNWISPKWRFWHSKSRASTVPWDPRSGFSPCSILVKSCQRLMAFKMHQKAIPIYAYYMYMNMHTYVYRYAYICIYLFVVNHHLLLVESTCLLLEFLDFWAKKPGLRRCRGWLWASVAAWQHRTVWNHKWGYPNS